MKDLLACIHRGDQVGEKDARCAGIVPVFACQHPFHPGETLLRKVGCDPTHRTCQGCNFQERPDGGGTLWELSQTPLDISPATQPRAEPALRLEGVSGPRRPRPEQVALSAPRPNTPIPDLAVARQNYAIWKAFRPPEPAWIKHLAPAYATGHELWQPSLARTDEGWLVAYRAPWGNSRIWLAGLDEQFQVVRTKELAIPAHPWAAIGYEDPRLFRAGGKLYVSYTGWSGKQSPTQASMLYSEITEQGKHVRQFAPQLDGRNAWEKNWVFFEDSGLKAVYDPANQVVVSLDGDGQPTRLPPQPYRHRWQWGVIRGGAAPVRVGDEWYHFFHGMLGLERLHQSKEYSLGVMTFEAQAPYRVKRFGHLPLLLPDPELRPNPGKPFCVFPCGAVLHDSQWIISAGWFDMTGVLLAWDTADIERWLTPL